jgi:hypothetical protein
MTLDLANRHPARVKADASSANDPPDRLPILALVEAVEPGLPLRHQLRLKRTRSVARHVERDLPILGQDRLRARPIPTVAAAAAVFDLAVWWYD